MKTMKKILMAISMLLGLLASRPLLAATDGNAIEQHIAPSARAQSPARGPGPAHNPEGLSYAAREKAAPQVANFNGGHRAVYIGGSTVVIILLVVLLIVLL